MKISTFIGFKTKFLWIKNVFNKDIKPTFFNLLTNVLEKNKFHLQCVRQQREVYVAQVFFCWPYYPKGQFVLNKSHQQLSLGGSWQSSLTLQLTRKTNEKNGKFIYVQKVDEDYFTSEKPLRKTLDFFQKSLEP